MDSILRGARLVSFQHQNDCDKDESAEDLRVDGLEVQIEAITAFCRDSVLRSQDGHILFWNFAIDLKSEA